MKRFLLPSAVVLALTVAGGVTYNAFAGTNDSGPVAAQQPPPPGPWNGPGGPGGPRGPGGWGPGRGPGWPGGRPGFNRGRDGKFSLFAPVQNKNLSVADVKVIASALLLENGNHAWAVSGVTAEPDKSINFSYSTQHGDVIATFAIDPASGRIKRVS